MYVKPALCAIPLAVENNSCCRGMVVVAPKTGTVEGSSSDSVIQPVAVSFVTPLCPFPVPGSFAFDISGISAYVSST